MAANAVKELPALQRVSPILGHEMHKRLVLNGFRFASNLFIRGKVPSRRLSLRLIGNLAKYGDYRRVAFVMLNLEKLSPEPLEDRLYSNWMVALKRGGNGSRVLSVLKHMKEVGRAPAFENVNKAIKLLAQTRHFDLMETAKGLAKPTTPDELLDLKISYINAYTFAQEFDKARDEWIELQASSCRATTALRVPRDVVAKSVKLNTAYMRAHIKNNDPLGASFVFEEFMAIPRVKPDRFMYLMAINCYGSLRKTKAAAQAYANGLRLTPDNDRLTYILTGEFMRAMLKCDQLQAAEELYNKIKSEAGGPEIGAMMLEYARRGNLERFENIVSEVATRNHKLFSSSHKRYVNLLTETLQRTGGANDVTVKERLSEIRRVVFRGSDARKQAKELRYMPPPREAPEPLWKVQPRDPFVIKEEASNDNWAGKIGMEDSYEDDWVKDDSEHWVDD